MQSCKTLHVCTVGLVILQFHNDTRDGRRSRSPLVGQLWDHSLIMSPTPPADHMREQRSCRMCTDNL